MSLQRSLQRLTGSDDAFLHKSVVQWGLPLVAALLPIVLLSVLSDRMASGAVEQLLLSRQLALTSTVARDVTRVVVDQTTLVNAVASLPKTQEAVASDDKFTLQSRLKAVAVAEPDIERAFVLASSGETLASFPAGSETLGPFAWFGQAVASAGPEVTDLYGRKGMQPTVAVTAPIHNASGATVAVLVLEIRPSALRQIVEALDLPDGGSVGVLDAQGMLVMHTATASTLHTVSYGDPVAQGVTVTIDDPITHRPSTATFLPLAVGKQTWTVVASQDSEAAFGGLRQLRAGLLAAGVFLTAITLGMVLMLARIQMRNIRLNRSLESANQDLREVAAIVEASNDPIIGLTTIGLIRTWNAAAQRLYGHTELAVAGKPLANFLPNDRKAELAGWIADVLAGKTVAQQETVRLRADGSQMPVAVTLSPVRDAAGAVVEISCIDTDISTRKEIEQMKDDFISFVSHQLKAPVTATRWTIEGMLDGDYGPVTEELKEPLNQLHDVTTKNFALISDILNVSRIDRGVIEVQTVPTQLRDVAERAMRDYRVAAQKAGLTLTMEGADHDILVAVDLEKMAEAVTNAISNAIKHTKQGGITLRLSKEGEFGLLDVADTGEGMPPAMIEKLFSRAGVKGKNTQAASSSGLGLYIAKHFMELQKGDITVTSEVGKGSVFRYRIPLAQAPHGG